jgi:hypothetical protein
MTQALNAQNLPLPSIVQPKLITPSDIGQTLIKAKLALPDSSASSKGMSSKSKKEKKKALLKAMLDSFNDSDDVEDDTASEASSVAAFDPQRNYFGKSRFDSQDYVPGLKDL